MAKFKPLLDAGWEVIPLAREGGKKPLVDGHHGADHEVADAETVKGWAKRYPDCNPAIVLPPGIVGLDVDNHDADGLLALDEFERVNGELPEGPHIFHGYQGDGRPSPYGTYLFTVPPEVLDRFGPRGIVGNLNKVTGLPGVDVIAPWLRYNVAPGAVHKSGETYEWAVGTDVVETCSPTDCPMLSVQQAEALLSRRAKAAPRPSKPITGAEAPAPAASGADRGTALLKQVRALAELPEGETLRIEGADRGWQHNDGFYVLACALRRLCEETGRDPEVIKAKFVKAASAGGVGLDEFEAERQWENAEYAVETDDLGGDDEEGGPYRVAAIQRPIDFTDEYLSRVYTDADGVLTLRFSDLRFWLWEHDQHGSFFRPLLPSEMKSRLTDDLHGEHETMMLEDGPETRPIVVSRRLKAEVLDALEDRTLDSHHGAAGALLDAVGGVPFKNGWLNVETGVLEPISPARNVRWCVPGDYDPDAPDPVEWLKFLDSIGFTADTDEYRLLRQWFGYLLSGSTKQQKALLMIGPPRAGKGTILRVAEAMFGLGAVGLDLGAFGTNFGLSPIIGKGLATVDDARFDVKTDKATVRRILTLVAEGMMSIDRKHKDPVSVQATARVMMATNELPALLEASSALATRFVFLNFTKSFVDQEDRFLLRRVLTELPGIVRWALDGLADLDAMGRFVETDAGRVLKREMVEIGNPIQTFIEEECELEPSAWTSTHDLHEAYVMWAERGHYYVPSVNVFARDLNAAFADSELRPGQRRIGSKNTKGFIGVRLGV